MGYRHLPLSRRQGLAFGASPAWLIRMPQAECFAFFVAHLQRLFGRGNVLYVEGRGLDEEVAELYRRQSAATPLAVRPLDRHPAVRRFHVAMGPGLTKPLNELATRKTFAQIGEALLVYDLQGTVWMDASRLAERRVLLSGEISEQAVRRFAGGRLHGELEWVED